jgi:hypothetical protein
MATTYWTGILGQPVASSQKNGKSDPVYDSFYPRVTKISFSIVVQMNGTGQNLP